MPVPRSASRERAAPVPAGCWVLCCSPRWVGGSGGSGVPVLPGQGGQALRVALPASSELIARFPQPAVHLITHPAARLYVSWSDIRYVSSDTLGRASVPRPFPARPHCRAAALQSWLCNSKNRTEALRDHRNLQHLVSPNLEMPHNNKKCPSAPVQEVLVLLRAGTGGTGTPGQHMGQRHRTLRWPLSQQSRHCICVPLR